MRFVALLFCLVVAVAAVQNAEKSETIDVIAPVGKIRGSFMKTRLNRTIYSFRGIRYGKSPVGELRFQPPVPVASWNDVFDATKEGPSCPTPFGQFQSEDCLRLNVYTTKLPSANASKGKPSNPKRPVIVYFHSGGFYAVSGQSLVEGPDYYMDQDIVLVVPNYRLGSLGFISTGDANAPGNLGLKDQVAVLKWVQKNIAAFGGDPNSVTIIGYSAGGWSVVLHMLSPMSRGLFHRAIAMSGSPIYQTTLGYHQMHLARKQAELLGCPSDNSSIIISCLKTKDAIEIGATLPQFAEWHSDPVLIWTPVIEPEVPGVERFLTAAPEDLIRQGKLYHVPFIAGITKDEFGGAVVPMIESAKKGNFSTLNDLNENWNKIAPISFYYATNPRADEISRTLKQFYLNGQPVTVQNYGGLSRLYGDALVGFHVHRLVTLMAGALKAPMYYYKFSYQGRYSHVAWNDTKKPYGVLHHDDLLYLFYVSIFPYYEKNAPELPIVARMTSMWANFAKTGKPVPRDDPNYANFVWTPYKLENKKYLDINDDLVMKTNLYADRMALFDRLFPVKPLEN